MKIKKIQHYLEVQLKHQNSEAKSSRLLGSKSIIVMHFIVVIKSSPNL